MRKNNQELSVLKTGDKGTISYSYKRKQNQSISGQQKIKNQKRFHKNITSSMGLAFRRLLFQTNMVTIKLKLC